MRRYDPGVGDLVRPLVAIAAVEALGVLATMVATLVSGLRAGDAVSFVLSGAAVYGVFAAGMALVVAGLVHRRSWARAPFIVVQLFTLVVAWNAAGTSQAFALAAVLAMLAATGLVLALHPRTRAALR
jgi:hypothetical protein